MASGMAFLLDFIVDRLNQSGDELDFIVGFVVVFMILFSKL